jgi:tetratricopeptide (TPR) repeat protein
MAESDQRLTKALEAHTRGDFATAEQAYSAFLRDVPENAQALYLLGTLRLQQGNHSLAESLLGRSLQLNPANAPARMNLGALLQQCGRHEEALVQFRAASELAPSNPELLNNIGFLLLRLREYEQAVAPLERALALRPGFPEAMNNLAGAYQSLGRDEQAEAIWIQALGLVPDHVEVMNSLGAFYSRRSRFDAARPLFERVVQLSPDFKEAWLNLGNLYSRLQLPVLAISAYQQVLGLDQKNADGLAGLGNMLRSVGRIGEGALYAHRLIAADPTGAAGWNLLGLCYLDGGFWESAAACFARESGTGAASPLMLTNLGLLMHNQNRLAEAIRYYDQALQVEPDAAVVHWNKAHALLALGDFDQGWVEYAWRFHQDGIGPHGFPEPEWQGESLDGKGILIHSEQGAGDVFQFMRYVPQVEQRGGRVIFRAWPQVLQLLAHTKDARAVEDQQAIELRYDVQIPLLTLPKVFKTSVDQVPAPIPYVQPNANLIQTWADRLGAVRGFRIGIVWAGNPAHKNDHKRSCALSHFGPLARLPGVSFFGLQKGRREVEAADPPEGMSFWDLGPELGDFADTAAVIANLDLVISVDTSVVHLAGAMGRPVWTLLAYNPDWRWMLDRDDSPWYPTMRLFRQKKPGDWLGLFAAVYQALKALLTECAPTRLDPMQSRSLSALVAYEKGEYEEAYAIYQEILLTGYAPRDLLFQIMYFGLESGRHDAARGLLENAVVDSSDAVVLRHCIARLLYACGSRDEAVNLCLLEEERAVPLYAGKHLGQILFDMGRYEEAERVWSTALSQNPDVGELHYLAGRALHGQGRIAEARDHYVEAVASWPWYSPAHNNLAVTQERLGERDEALINYQQAVRLDPLNEMAWGSLGRLLVDGVPDFAEACLERAVELKPGNWVTHYTLAQARFNLGRFESAVDGFSRVLEMRPGNVDAIVGKASTLWQLDRLDEAETCCRQALEYDPENVDAHMTLCWCLLPRGDYERGWAEYEWRLRQGEQPSFGRPRWDGSPLAGRKLLLHAEQGLGDTLQFVRFMQRFAQEHIMLAVQDSLVPLLRDTYGEKIISSNTAQEASLSFDFHLPLLSIPFALGLHEERDLVVPAPYLVVDGERRENWAHRLGHEAGLRVGIAWAGNPNHRDDAKRSTKLAQWDVLWGVSNVAFYSLQKGEAAAQLEDLPTGVPLIGLGEELHDFKDTAAVVEQLDLVIAVDTAVAHLAGALGKPVWVLLPHRPDWRWMQEREDCPWYSSMRLFRQARQGDWSSVFGQVRNELTRLSDEGRISATNEAQ